MADFPDPGPLPQSDDKSVLQAESFKALANALPATRFILREEPQPDGGVDQTIELRLPTGHFSGWRSFVQVKGVGSGETNRDGSISFSAAVSNINYLLYHPCPLYVLYLAGLGKLKYVWVREESERIETQNPDWKKQGTVTLAFRKDLDETGLNDLYETIRRSSLFDRNLRDLLSRSDASEVTLHIDSENLTVTDPAEFKELLLKYGLPLVESGKGTTVIELIEKLSPLNRKLPRICLIRAFAECSRGRYTMASGDLSEARIHTSELSESDRLLLEALRDLCDYQATRITRDEYAGRQKQLSERSSGEFGLALKLRSLWESLAENATLEGANAFLPEIQAVADQASSLEGGSTALRIHARTALLYAEGIRFCQAVLRDLVTLRIRQSFWTVVDWVEFWNAVDGTLSNWANLSNAPTEACRGQQQTSAHRRRHIHPLLDPLRSLYRHL